MQNSKKFLWVLRIGLALVFLTNSLTAFLQPDEFKDLLGGSFVPGLLHLSVGTLVMIIAFNDLLVCLLLLSGRWQKVVATWSMIWLVLVIVVVGEPLDIMEHLGFFSMGLYLWLTA